MSTDNICFCREERKIFTRYPLLSGAMVVSYYSMRTDACNHI